MFSYRSVMDKMIIKLLFAYENTRIDPILQ